MECQKTQFVSMLLTFCVGLPKIVILALYIRFFGVYMRFKYFALVCIAAVVIAYVSSVPLSFYLAYPRGGEAWSTDVVLRNLNAVKVYGMFNGIFALVADIMILLMPIPVLRKLKLAHSKKVRLYVVFAAGFLCVPPLCSSSSIFFCLTTDQRRCLQPSLTCFPRPQPLSVRLHVGAGNLLCLHVCMNSLHTFLMTLLYSQCLWSRVAEGYITIIVSCVPALYALWYNQVIKSSVYRSIKSAVSGFLNSSSSATEDVNFNRRNDIGSRKNLCPPTQQPNNAPERKSSVTANP